MIQVVTNGVRVRCGDGAGSRTEFYRIDKPTWELGAGGAAFIKKVWKHIKRCVIEGYSVEQPAPPALLQVDSAYLRRELLVRVQAQPAPNLVAYRYKEMTIMAHAITGQKYIREAQGILFHLPNGPYPRPYSSLCGKLALRTSSPHLVGRVVMRSIRPEPMCKDCLIKEKSA